MKYILLERKNSEAPRPIEFGAHDRLRTFQMGYKQALMSQGWRSYATYHKDYYNLVDGNGQHIQLYILTEQEWKDEE
jgi:hypothetical protein